MANAKTASIKDGRVRTPRGIAAFAYLTKPDTSYDKCRHRITLFFEKKDPEFKAFVKTLKALAKSVGMPASKLPLKLANEKLSETCNVPVGTPHIEFASNTQEGGDPLPIFNARGQVDGTLDVWGGDLVRVETSFSTWELSGKTGIKGYLNAVQLLQSNGGGRADAGSSFETEEEYLTEDEVEAPEADDDGLEDEGDGDDSPFGDESDDDDPTAGLM